MGDDTRSIQTRYAGCHFRSRLEARWAVFFDTYHIPWLYEPEGFELPSGRYLPDFLLPECGTWIEVRGAESRVDINDLTAKARELPEREPALIGQYKIPLRDPDSGRAIPGWLAHEDDFELVDHYAEPGPRLMLLGHIPPEVSEATGDWGWTSFDGEGNVSRYGFAMYPKNNRPWWVNGDSDRWLEPVVDRSEFGFAHPAYRAARSARFEFGQSGAR